MRRTGANWLGLAAICGTSLVGCTMSMSGGAYPPRPAGRPVMSPTAGYYAPMAPQTVTGPVAVTPITMTASTASPTIAPTPTATTASAPIATMPAGPRTTAVYYHVNQGDTLTAIAQRYQTTVDDIRNANKISGNNELSPGQMVLIPNSGTAIR
jgi:LysM repeat protein